MSFTPVLAWAQASWSMMVDLSLWLLIGLLVSGVLYAWLPGGWIRRHLAGDGTIPVLKAAMVGVPLPLCSCGVIPVASHLRKEGAGQGATLAFLVSTPTSGVDSILATSAMLGLPFAILRTVVSGVAGILVGFLAGKSSRDNLVNASPTTEAKSAVPIQVRDRERPGLAKGTRQALDYAFGDLAADIAKWVVIGVVAGGAITAFVPDGFLTSLQGGWAYLGALVVGIPLYVCATGAIPMAAALMAKGFGAGAALVFLIVGPATNVSTILFVNGTFGRKVLVIYLAVIAFCAIAAGLLVDHLLFSVVGDPTHHHQSGAGFLELTAAIFLSVVFLYHLMRKYFSKRKKTESHMPVIELNVPAISCQNCVRHVQKALQGINGVTDIQVDVATKCVRVSGTASSDAIRSRLQEEGYPPT